MNTTDLQLASKTSQLRRSQRVCLRLPILVLREGPGPNVASEETRTLIVNAHGALIQLALTVAIGQLLGVKNTQTMEERVCRVINLGLDQAGKREVGVELEVPSPRLWRIAFPPSDWTPRSPDAKAPAAHSPGGKALQKKTGVVPPEPHKKLVNKSGGPF